ncbi:MAG TPA: hypothetical protein VIQ99_08510 [Gammaproteobacteria bacterium]
MTMIRLGCAVAIAAALTACLPPESEAPAADSSPPPTAHPDLSGVWMAFAVESPDGARTPQYSPEGEAMLAAFAAQFTQVPETGAWCYGSGMPGMMLSTVSYPIEIVQHPTRLVMVAELETQVRRVYLDGRPHPDDFPPQGVGHSVGTWDGDTLVIDTALLSEWPMRPWPRTEQMRIVERVHLTKLGLVAARPTGFVATVEKPINDDVLVIEMTITDPAVYAGPERRTAYYQRMADTATLEYACSAEHWLEELEKNRVSR